MELTLHVRNPVFYIFDVSGGQTSAKSPENLRGSFSWKEKTCGRRIHGNWARRPKRGPSTRPDSLAAWRYPFWPLRPQILPSSSYRLRLDLKPTIKRVPRTLTEGGAAETPKHQNRETEGCRRRRSEGGNAPGITPGGLHPPPACSSSTSTARSAPSLTVISWQTRCMMQYYIPLMYCVSPSMFE